MQPSSSTRLRVETVPRCEIACAKSTKRTSLVANNRDGVVVGEDTRPSPRYLPNMSVQITQRRHCADAEASQLRSDSEGSVAGWLRTDRGKWRLAYDQTTRGGESEISVTRYETRWTTMQRVSVMGGK